MRQHRSDHDGLLRVNTRRVWCIFAGELITEPNGCPKTVSAHLRTNQHRRRPTLRQMCPRRSNTLDSGRVVDPSTDSTMKWPAVSSSIQMVFFANADAPTGCPNRLFAVVAAVKGPSASRIRINAIAYSQEHASDESCARSSPLDSRDAFSGASARVRPRP